MNDDLSLQDMTNHEAELWRLMVEPEEEPEPQSLLPSETVKEQAEDEGEELPSPVSPDSGVESQSLELPDEESTPQAQLSLPDEPENTGETLDLPGEPGNAEMGPEGIVDSPPVDSAEPVLPVVDSMGDEMFPGELVTDTPPLPDDPALELPEEPDAPEFDINDWRIETTNDYSGGRRMQGRERVIDVNVAIPEGFEAEMAKQLEPQMGMLLSRSMDHTANVIEEFSVLGGTTGAPY